MQTDRLLAGLKHGLTTAPDILTAQAYGSWLYNGHSVDVDIAAVVPSCAGVVDPGVYVRLRLLRQQLSEMWLCDVDLVPHTEDEFCDLRSPLWYPRYNPSLVFGVTLNGDFPIQPVYDRPAMFEFSDLTAYVLYDNRTICRRQLVRSLDGESGRIYVSKLLHGMGNALTYHSCSNKVPYLCSPSDLTQNQLRFDEVFGVCSNRARQFFVACKENLDFEHALLLMSWYENLVNLVIKGQEYQGAYQSFCDQL